MPLSPLALFLRTLQRHPPRRSKAATTLLGIYSPFGYADFSVYLLDGSSERGEKDASKITTYPPGAVRFDSELRAVQVSCGFHHSGKRFLCCFSPLMVLSGCYKQNLLYSGADGEWRCLHVWVWPTRSAWSWRRQLQVTD